MERSVTIEMTDRMPKRIAVFFPGIGYTADKPLLYYSRKLASSLDYEVRILSYTGFPDNIQEDAGKKEEAFKIALDQSLKMLEDMDLESYEDILFIGKSIGTIAAAKIASESPVRDRIRLVLYTPLEETFLFSFGNAIVFTGSDDPWVGRKDSRIPDLCRDRQFPCHIISGGNHSLERNILYEDIRILTDVLKETERFIRQIRNDRTDLMKSLLKS